MTPPPSPDEAPNPWSGGPFTATRGAAWELLAETAEEAPHLIYAAECVACPEQCRMDNDPRPIQAWTIEHTRAYPTHRQYLLTMQKHARVAPVHREERQPEPTEPEPPGPRSHARPRRAHRTRRARSYPAPLARALAAVGRMAGPVLMVILSTACGLVIGTALPTGTR